MNSLLLTIPLITGVLAVVVFISSFYGIKHNRYGVKAKAASNYFPIFGNKSAADLKEFQPLFKMSGVKHKQEIIGWPKDKNKRRKVLIATLEYEIIDWKLKVKIGSMTNVDLGWVGKVKDQPAEPIEVIELLNRSLFCTPARMDDLSSADLESGYRCHHSLFPHYIYVNDYHGSLAPSACPFTTPNFKVSCTKEEMKEVCSTFNISKEHCMKYI